MSLFHFTFMYIINDYTYNDFWATFSILNYAKTENIIMYK